MLNPHSLTGAICSAHPELPARDVCARCGSFRCEQCAADSDLCPPCRKFASSGAPFPFSRSRWSFSELFDYALACFRRQWLMLSVTGLLFFVISGSGSFVGTVAQAIGQMVGTATAQIVAMVLAQVANIAVQGIATLGIYRIAIDVLQGRPPEPARMFVDAWKIGRYLVQILLVVALVGACAVLYFGLVALLVFGTSGKAPFQGLFAGEVTGKAAAPFLIAAAIAIVPAIYVLIPAYFAPYELVLSDRLRATDALRNSYAVLRGGRLAAIGTWLVMGFVSIAGVLACCAGIFPALAFSMLLQTGLYLALRNGAEMPVEAAGGQ